jgi:PAS domain S-box-containing protein
LILNRLTIRAGLIWLVAVCLLPVVVLVGLFVYLDYLEEHARLARNSLVTSRALMALVDAEFSATEASMQILSTSAKLNNGDYSAFHNRAKDVLKHTNANNIVLMDASGQQIVNTAVPYGQPLPMTPNMEQLRAVMTTGKPQISNLFMGPALLQPVITVAVPVYQGDIVVQSLVAVLLPDRIQQILLSERLSKERIASIFDRSNNIVAFNGDIARARGQQVNQGLVQALKKADEGSLDTVNRLGVEVVSSFTRSPISGWGVVVATPRAALLSTLSQNVLLLLGIGMLLFMCSFAFAWFMGGRITRAILELNGPARKLGYGKSVVVPELPISEVDEVGRALTSASAMLTATRRELSNREAQLRGIVESATDAVVIVNDQGSIVLFNTAAAAMFGCPSAEAVGSSFLRFIPERLHAAFADQLLGRSHRQTNADGKTVIEIITVRRSDGNEFMAELSFPQLVDGAGKVNTFILRDITDRLRIQEALERSNLDLQQFAFVASHDLKTPLRSIDGFLQMLQKNYADQLDDKARMLIQRTLNAASRLGQLTDDLLSYARVNSEIRPFTLIDCTEVASDAISLLDSVIAETQAIVTIDPLPGVMGDRTQLIQLFMNLVGNGLKYCRDRTPVVHVSVSRNGSDWLFSVADNGIGIEAQHHDLIFEVFKRLHNQNEYPGTGIGLAVCRRVVKHHGGTIWFTSVPGQGSTFYFTIPNYLVEKAPDHDAPLG